MYTTSKTVWMGGLYIDMIYGTRESEDGSKSCHYVRSMTSGGGRMTGLVSSRLTFSVSLSRR